MLIRFAAFLLLTASLFAETPAPLWIDVPFVSQPREGCGAASISMIMQYWARQEHAQASPASQVGSIQQQLYSRREHGITPAAMENYFRQHGFLVFAVSGTWADLQNQVEKGRPLIVALRPTGQSDLHYVVIDGIDSTHGLITMNDPAERKLMTQERAGFEEDWSATHNWMLLAVPASAQKSE